MSASRYYLALDGQVSGPHGLEALRDMASVHAFTRDTLATPEGVENWQPIRALPVLADKLFPAANKFQLKAKAVALTADSITPVSVEEILRDNLAAETRTARPPDHTSRPSRPPGRQRNRDYVFSMTAGLSLGFGAWLILPHNPAVFVFLLAYVTILSVSLYWIFFHVMDRY